MKFESPESPDKQSNPETGIPDWEKRLYKRAVTFTVAGAILFNGVSYTVKKTKELLDDRNNRTNIEQVDKEMSVDLEGLGNESNLEVKVREKSADDAYIMHVGQIHAGGWAHSENQKSEQDVLDSQKEIEKMLLTMEEKGLIDKVYVEGTPGNFPAEVKEIKHLKEGYDVLKNDHAAFVSYAEQRMEEIKEEIKKNKDGFTQSKVECTVYLFQQEVTAVKAKLGADEGATAEKLDGYLAEVGALYTPKTPEYIYHWGAAMKLYLEGKIDYVSAENDDTRAKEGDDDTFREKVALGVIEKTEGHKPHSKIIPLVFGYRHDFEGSLKGYNQEVAGDYGLIDFKPVFNKEVAK